MTTTKKLYKVTRESNRATTRVRAASREDAALRGAVKLGVRYRRSRLPTLVLMLTNDDSYWQTYCYDSSLGASSNIHQPVIVSEI